MTLASRLRQTRLSLGISQKELATRSGVTQQMISKLERGEAAGSVDLVAIAGALQVTAEWLFSGAGAAPGETPEVRCESAPYHVAPRITPQEEVLIEYFRALTERQRADVIRDLHDKKQGNEEILNALLKRRKA